MATTTTQTLYCICITDKSFTSGISDVEVWDDCDAAYSRFSELEAEGKKVTLSSTLVHPKVKTPTGGLYTLSVKTSDSLTQ